MNFRPTILTLLLTNENKLKLIKFYFTVYIDHRWYKVSRTNHRWGDRTFEVLPPLKRIKLVTTEGLWIFIRTDDFFMDNSLNYLYDTLKVCRRVS